MAIDDVGTAGEAAPRPRLSRWSVVTEAISFVDEHGLPALTMRRLGRQLGVEAMSLYRYVHSREDLLEAMVDELVHRLLRGRESEQPNDTWQGYLQWLAHAVRSMAVEHPHLFPLVATRNPAATWLRPPLRSLEVVEEFLATLRSHGFPGDRAVHAYQLFSSFLLGHLLVEATQRSTSPTLPEEQMEVEHRPDKEKVTDYPNVTELSGLLAADRTEEEFEDALEIVIGRLEGSFAPVD